MNTKKKQFAYFISLGCPRNLVDTEVMIGLALQHDIHVTTDFSLADFIVINTCGFLQASRQESIDIIKDALVNKRPSTKVIVTGCLVQLQPKELHELGIHYLLGSGNCDQIIEAMTAPIQGQTVSAKSFLEQGEVPRVLSTPPHYAYVKIAEGCRKNCSYCIIPKIKGPLRSKPIEQILHECKRLLTRGVRELMLIAQDLGDWGKDLGFKDSGLVHVLQQILSLPDDFSLRLLYVYPDEITPELAQLMASDPRILPYIDMPIQHVNDTILDKMKRSTSQEDIIAKITLLRETVPDISLRTSVIVGFPGETQEQFEELCHFIKQYPFDHLGIFSYSPEPLSASYALPNHLDEETKSKRCAKLGAIQKKLVMKKNRALIGKKLPITIDSFHPESRHLLIGRHAGQCPDVDSVVLINNADAVDAFGKKYLVEISDISEYDLIGSVITPL